MSSRDYPFVFSVSAVYMDTDSGRAESATVPELDKDPKLEQNQSGFLQVLLYKKDNQVRPEDEKINKIWYSHAMTYDPAFNPKETSVVLGRPPQG